MRAGKLRTPVQLQQQARTPDGAGGAALAWTTYATVYAGFEPGRFPTEPVVGDQPQSTVAHVVHIRWHASLGLKAGHRILYGTRTFNIIGVRNVSERNATAELDVHEGVAT